MDFDDLDARVAAYAASADSNNTVRTYIWAWKRFTAWCERTGHVSLPASPQTINRYMTQAADDSDNPVASSTLEVWRAAIACMHGQAGLADPTADPSARRTRRGIRKTRAVSGETLLRAPVAVLSDVQSMVETAHADARTWRAQVAARRDIALILVSYDFARRRSDTVALTIGDLAVVEDDTVNERLLRMRLPGNSIGHGRAQFIYRPRGSRDGLMCSWCGLARWIAVLYACDSAAEAARGRSGEALSDARSVAVQRLLRRDTGDPREHCCGGTWLVGRAAASIFRSLSHGGIPHAPETALSGRSVSAIINARSREAGIGRRSGHSLRAGVSTQMYDDGATDEQVMALAGYRNPASAQRYDRRRAQRSAASSTGL
ncbi:tyrosine-type recombinase/integrase [Nocardia jejuensis]|uniref:tyrosine-type recombinase/integrase n=1 Tax=Nocardia jejuensis TaxID=328049 RepID=UPI001471A5E0|nr:tyrosine-type recombinase/integrase [Nocardia jejuensis]